MKITTKSIPEFLKIIEERSFSSTDILNLDLSESVSSPADVAALVNVLMSGKAPAGLRMNFYENGLGYAAAVSFVEALMSGKAPGGLHLHLNDNEFGFEAAIAFAKALTSGRAPQGLHLDFSRNPLGSEGVVALADALTSDKAPSGLRLDFRGNRLGPRVAIAFAKALTSGRAPKGLRLDLSQNLLGFEGVTALADALMSGRVPNALHLGLRINHIDFAGAIHLTKALTGNRALSDLSLDLSFNKIDTDGVAALLSLLINEPSSGLKIDFSYNLCIGPKGAQTLTVILGTALKKGILQNLSSCLSYLTGGNIGDVGAEELANLLMTCQLPENLHLDLKNNGIQDRGATALAEALGSGKLPRGLWLDLSEGEDERIDFFEFEEKLPANSVGNKGTVAFAMALQSGKAPQGLSLSLNMETEGILAFASALQSGKAPDGLSLCFHSRWSDAKAITALGTALQSGKAPQGLSLNLRGLQYIPSSVPRWARSSVDFASLGAFFKQLKRGLNNGSLPQGLRVVWDGWKKSLAESIMAKNDRMHSMLAGVQFYKGHEEIKSSVSRLPEPLIYEICSYLAPPTGGDEKASSASKPFATKVYELSFFKKTHRATNLEASAALKLSEPKSQTRPIARRSLQ